MTRVAGDALSQLHHRSHLNHFFFFYQGRIRSAANRNNDLHRPDLTRDVLRQLRRQSAHLQFYEW